MIYDPKPEFMQRAVDEAIKAFKRGDYAIGACIVTLDGELVVAGGNRVKTKRDSTKHIELELIQYAVGTRFGNYLEDCVLYSTHEPCPMCSGAAVWSRLGGIVFGNFIADFKAHTGLENYLKWRVIDIPCSKVVEGNVPFVHGGFLREECLKLFTLPDSLRSHTLS